MDRREWTNFIDELKRRNDIVDVVSLYAQVQQKGRRYWARCPIHNEKTPSFSISRENQTFHCFGCHRGGDVISFIEEIEGFSFMEAAEHLAKRANLAMPESNLSDEQIAKAKKLKDGYYAVCLAAAKHYHENLLSEEGKTARDYLNSRGVSKSTWTTFGLGVSTGYDALIKTLKAQGFSMETAKKAGVAQSGKTGEYDALYGRLIIPILNAAGQVVAFGGRLLENREGFAKYKNTGETPIFEKSKNLYGINIIKKQKTTQQVENIVIVEGYMDVIALYQAGFNRVVASMGTALTKEQAKLLRRYTNEVYICYDGDAAGEAATLRGLDILRGEGLDVYVVSLPGGSDPDDFVRKHGAEEYRSRLDAALPLVAYKLENLKKQFDISHPSQVKRDEFRRKYVENAIPILRSLGDVERESYTNSVAVQTGYSKEFLAKAAAADKEAQVAVPPKKAAKMGAEMKALSFIARCLMNEDWAHVPQKPFCYGSAALESIFDYAQECKERGVKPIPSMVYQLAEGEDGIIDAVIAERASNERTDKEYFADCLAYLKKREIKAELDRVSDEYNQASGAGCRAELLEQITLLTNRINSIKDINLTEEKDGNN